jgi:lysophospholipase L1-like esterase
MPHKEEFHAMSDSAKPQGRESASVDAQKLDPNMRLAPQEETDLRWLSPGEAPLRLSGFPWFREERKYRRLPVQPSHPIRPEVDALANSTAGGQIAFRTDSSKLAVRVVLAGKAGMYHMPATGQCGFDLYAGAPGEQLKYVATSRYDHTQTEYEAVLFTFPQRELREVTLNFPLYQGVREVWVGIEPDAEVAAPTPYRSGRKVIVYGTSITQGGCASRPGMAYTNILSRRIPLEFVNLGFSGNGKGEPELARIIAQIEDPALLALDYEANVGVDQMRDTLPEFIRIYRETHPHVPILVISRIRYARDRFEPALLQKRLEMRRIESETVEALRRQGDANVHFFDGSELLGSDDWEECTVDGIHPTDLGFLRMADGLAPVFRKLLARELQEVGEAGAGAGSRNI